MATVERRGVRGEKREGMPGKEEDRGEDLKSTFILVLVYVIMLADTVKFSDIVYSELSS